MQRIFRTLLFWTFILCACSIGVTPADTVPQIATETTPPSTTVVIATTEAFSDSPALPIPKFSRTVETPHIDQPPNPQDCGYQWANQDLPELSSSFQKSIQALQSEAQANAYAFGENCIRSDGSIAGFSAMETDFNITLQVNDLTNESDLGEWIVKVMQVILNISQDQIVGSQPGRVSITFQANADQKVVNFYVNQYQALPPGLSSSEIYQSLQVP
jgi:hypothetical protein